MWQKVHLSKWLYICTAFCTLKSIMGLVKWHLDCLLPANQAVYIKILYSELLEAASKHLWTRKKPQNEDRIFIYDSLPLLPRKMVIEYKIVRVKKASTLVEEMGMTATLNFRRAWNGTIAKVARPESWVQMHIWGNVAMQGRNSECFWNVESPMHGVKCNPFRKSVRHFDKEDILDKM